ncbi:MAG: hypothetical protein ACJA0E_000377 [Bermanella sp.]|jgi:hypothetical protein
MTFWVIKTYVLLFSAHIMLKPTINLMNNSNSTLLIFIIVLYITKSWSYYEN